MWVELNGKKWRVRDWRGGAKVTIASGYRTKTAANAARTQLEAEAMRGDSLVPRGGRMTLEHFVGQWWPHYSRTLKPSTLRSEESRLRIHILAKLGGYELDQIDAGVVQDWVAGLTVSPKTVHNCHGLLHTIFKAAVGQRLIRYNAAASTSLPRHVRYEMRFLTDPEIARLLSATPEYWRPLVALLVATGLRWGEAVGLRVGRVDLLAPRPRLVVLEHMHDLPNAAEPVFTDPKSARSRRSVTFTRNVALQLAPLVAGRAAEELLFTATKGGPVRAGTFRTVWAKILADAGLGKLRIHDLRHTHAAILFAANRPLGAISRRLGHSSIAVTDALYGHIREEVDEGILAAIEAAMPTLASDLKDEIILGAA